MGKPKAPRRKERKPVGRPRMVGVDREPNGRPSRAQPKEDSRMVALQARERHTGLPANLASHEKAGSVLGRLWLRQQITTPMREAGEEYQKRHADMLRAIKAPNNLAKGAGKGADGDLVTDEYVDWAIRAVGLYEVAKGWLDDARLRGLVERVVVEDGECASELLQYLSAGLQLLADRMGISQEKAA